MNERALRALRVLLPDFGKAGGGADSLQVEEKMLADHVPTERLHSLGHLAELLQASPGAIQDAAERAGVRVALKIDERCYFGDEDISAIRRALLEPETP